MTLWLRSLVFDRFVYFDLSLKFGLPKKKKKTKNRNK